MTFTYDSGEEIRAGDKIVYGGSPGEVEFVIFEPTGDTALDWYLTVQPGPCFMIKTVAMGLVLLHEADEDLDFVSRADGIGDPLSRG